MDNTTEALTPKTTPFGLVLAIVGGALAAVVMGFVYHLVANKVGIDYILALAVIVGLAVGTVVGFAARLGKMRAAMVAAVIAFVFGVGGYAARYVFEFNNWIDTIIQENAPAGMEYEVARDLLMSGLAEEYPPGGVIGYLQIVAEGGFSIGSRGSSNSDAPIKGGLAWGLLALEALAAGIAAGVTAHNAITKSTAPAAPVAPTMPAA